LLSLFDLIKCGPVRNPKTCRLAPNDGNCAVHPICHNFSPPPCWILSNIDRLSRRHSMISSHFPATRGALGTGLNARFHTVQRLAVFRARFAHFGAHGAHAPMKRRAADHQIRRRLTDGRTTDHQAGVVRRDVFAADFYAVLQEHSQANVVTAVAQIDAALHRFIRHFVRHE
jgi:hypothetical protein